jgi:hypothetical protein
MRNLTGSEFDDDCSHQFVTRADADRLEQFSLKKKSEESEMEHPNIKIENEPRFIDRQSGGHPMGGWGGDCGFGMGGMGGGILLGALLGRGLLGGGFGGWGGGPGFGGCDGGRVERPVFDAAILGKLGTIEGAIPLSGQQVQTQLALMTGNINTNALQIALGQTQQTAMLALGTQQQLSGVKDAVQAGTFATTMAVQQDGNQTRALIQSLETANLNRQLGVLETTLLLERQGRGFDRDHHSLVIQNTNTANAMQQQQQQQGFAVGRLFDLLHCCDQNIRATNQAINIGGGTLTANPTNTSTNNKVN